MTNTKAMITIPWRLYILNAHQGRHGGLHTLTSPHVLTERPQEGDEIVAVYRGTRTYDSDGRVLSGMLSAFDIGVLVCHPGRTAMLGEDGLEDAFGGDALSDLLPEIISGNKWTYAPCSLEGALQDQVRRRLTRTDSGWSEEILDQ